jgi:hypothetical protein
MFYFVSYVAQSGFGLNRYNQCVISCDPLEWWVSKQRANMDVAITVLFWKSITEDQYEKAKTLVLRE